MPQRPLLLLREVNKRAPSAPGKHGGFHAVAPISHDLVWVTTHCDEGLAKIVRSFRGPHLKIPPRALTLTPRGKEGAARVRKAHGPPCIQPRLSPGNIANSHA